MRSQNNSLKKKKCYVVDTSLLLHDPKAISVLGEHADIVLPRSVISDLGRLEKSRIFDASFTAGEALSEIERLRGDHPKFNGGLPINLKHKLIVYGLPQSAVGKADSMSQIVGVCQLPKLTKEYSPIVISKDKALRLMVASHDIHTEDYEYDAVESIYQGIEYVDADLVGTDQLTDEQRIANRFFISNSKKIQVFAHGKLQMLEKNGKDKFNFHGIMPRNREQVAALWALVNPDIQFVSLQGKAGCGKTLLALVAGVQDLVSNEPMYEKIIITRAMESVDGKDLGALPGSAEDKISPYMDGVWDNLETIKRHMEIINSTAKGKASDTKIFGFENQIIPVPFDLMRGRSLSKTLLIIDEAQNISAHAMKTLLTRIDDSSKVVIMGDNDQIDHPYLDSRSNGMVRAINHFKGYPKAAHITLISNERGDVSSFASKM